MSPGAAAASADGTVFTWDASPAAALSQAFTVPAPRCYTLSHLPSLSVPAARQAADSGPKAHECLLGVCSYHHRNRMRANPEPALTSDGAC
jgi:hypothetical protein